VVQYGGDAGINKDGKVIIVDQRFSNTLFLGDITGWQKVTCTKSLDNTDDDDNKEYDYIDHCVAASADTMQLQQGDKFKLTNVRFGYVSASTSANDATGDFEVLHHATGDLGFASTFDADADAFVRIDYDADRPTTTSIITEDYFAVGSTIEVLDTTWDLDHAAMQNDAQSANKYRTFKVLSHVRNGHGHYFAKLDSTPTDDSTSNYALKVTSNNYTVTTRKNIELSAVQNEVQSLRAFTGDLLKMSTVAGTDAYRLYINKDKANVEFTEVLDGASTLLEVQEAINAFSVLSGPVKVTRTGTGAVGTGLVGGEIIVTFAAIDGDVPQIEAVKESGSITWVSLTQHEGWSFFAGKGARLESVEPGAIINITSSETVEFTHNLDAGNMIFSYDGSVGSTAILKTSDAAAVASALNSIKDHKGAAKFATIAEADVTVTGTTKIKVVMPEGVDGSKLGLSPAGDANANTPAKLTTISKTVAKNNNGKSFKVVRVENHMQTVALTAATRTSVTVGTKHNVATAFAIAPDDEVRYTQSTAALPCLLVDVVKAAAETPVKDVLVTGVTYNVAATNEETVIAHEQTHASRNAKDGCSATIHRTTIVVDAMPDAMSARTFGKDVEMEIKGPAGFCSVTEAVKGTYESDVCSSRGLCDGGSGLCTCHEGYSGEACETQTVLV